MYKHDFIYCGGEYFRGSVISILHFSAAQIGTSHSLYKIKPKECLSILGLVFILGKQRQRGLDNGLFWIVQLKNAYFILAYIVCSLSYGCWPLLVVGLGEKGAKKAYKIIDPSVVMSGLNSYDHTYAIPCIRGLMWNCCVCLVDVFNCGGFFSQNEIHRWRCVTDQVVWCLLYVNWGRRS